MAICDEKVKKMNFKTIITDSDRATVRLAEFAPEAGAKEYNLMISTRLRGAFAEQVDSLIRSYDEVREQLGEVAVMFGRWLVSDAANQDAILPDEVGGRRLSVVEQPALDGSKVVLWLWLVEGGEVVPNGLRHGDYQHLWTADERGTGATSEEQSRDILVRYADGLAREGCTLADDCVRTWFYVQDVDNNYAGLVRARREFFEECGLRRDTHYIASTGIEGRNGAVGSFVTMDAYAVRGLREGQIQFLYARDYLSPTADYGVTFERGTAVHYGDRKHIFISGTASIDSKGEVVHVGDVRRQTERMICNIEALLAEGGATMNDVQMAIVYLRDMGDYEQVAQLLAERLPELPYTITLAPVCRPTWLIEMECVAAVAEVNEKFAKF